MKASFRYPPAALALTIALLLAGATTITAHRLAVADPPADTLTSRLIKFRVTGTFQSFDASKGDAIFAFSGPFYATQVDSATALVSEVAGPQIGEVQNATVRFHFALTNDALAFESATFSCGACKFVFGDGSTLEPLFDDPNTVQHEQNIPMEGRMLFSLGPVPGGDLSMQRIRGIGCGGAHETSGTGALANTKGAVCVNGTFAFSKDPTAITDPQELFSITGAGESNCTLVFHRPALGF